MPPIEHPTADSLRRSIFQHGCLQEVLFLHGLLIDGKKRVQVCDELGLTYPERHFLTVEEAAPILWLRHPERCANLFPAATISQAAELYQTDLASVAFLFKRAPPPLKELGSWKSVDAARGARHYSTRMPPELWAQLKGAAKKCGWGRDHLLRLACAFAVDNMDQIREFDRLFGRKLRYRRGRAKRP